MNNNNLKTKDELALEAFEASKNKPQPNISKTSKVIEEPSLVIFVDFKLRKVIKRERI